MVNTGDTTNHINLLGESVVWTSQIQQWELGGSSVDCWALKGKGRCGGELGLSEEGRTRRMLGNVVNHAGQVVNRVYYGY